MRTNVLMRCELSGARGTSCRPPASPPVLQPRSNMHTSHCRKTRGACSLSLARAQGLEGDKGKPGWVSLPRLRLTATAWND